MSSMYSAVWQPPAKGRPMSTQMGKVTFHTHIHMYIYIYVYVHGNAPVTTIEQIWQSVTQLQYRSASISRCKSADMSADVHLQIYRHMCIFRYIFRCMCRYIWRCICRYLCRYTQIYMRTSWQICVDIFGNISADISADGICSCKCGSILYPRALWDTFVHVLIGTWQYGIYIYTCSSLLLLLKLGWSHSLC